MTVHITKANSSVETGNAIVATGPDSLIVDAGAYKISETGAGAALTGDWTIKENGEIGAFEPIETGIFVSGVATITVGGTGDVFGGSDGVFAHGLNLTNFGTIAAADNGGEAIGSLGEAHVTNAGLLVGLVEFSGAFNDTFVDFKKVGNVIKNGTVQGTIDLGDGNDHFTGGAHAETVEDSAGSDTIKLGGGNDTYIAAGGGGSDGTDHVDGGAGAADLYDASSLSVGLDINLDSVAHTDVVTIAANLGVAKPPAIFGRDTITGFENANGGSGDDTIFGNKAANVLVGNDGIDHLFGYAGNDHLDGGAGADMLVGGKGADILTPGPDSVTDTFRFLSLSDSTVAASGRDTITSFASFAAPGVDDVIDLTAIDADTRTKNVDDPFHLTPDNGIGSFTHHAGELRFSYKGGDSIVSGDVNGDGHADFSILLKGIVFFASDSFML